MLKKILWITGLSGFGYYAWKSWKRLISEADEEEKLIEIARKKSEERLREKGLTEKDLDEICQENKLGTLKLAEILKKSITWDIEDTWKGSEDYISDNMILVSQFSNPNRTGKLDWTVKIKMPAFKPNTPIAPDYVEQVEQFLEDYLGIKGIDYRVKKKYFGIYNLSNNYTVNETGEKESKLYCFPIIADDLDAFKDAEGKGNGLEKMFELFKEEKYEELESKLCMREEMFLQDLEIYLEISIPVLTNEGIRGLDLLGMQDLLKELLGLQITNSRSGGRYAQTLGPIALCSDIENLNKEVTSFLIYEGGAFVEKQLKVSGLDD
jgi:hypothetical protein